MKASLDVSTGKPKMPKFYEVYDELTGLSQEIGLGKVSPEDGAKRGQQIMVKHCGQNCLL
jgi:multiple sugar transport system substrate-binding protein